MAATIISIALRTQIAAAIAATLGIGLVPQMAYAEPLARHRHDRRAGPAAELRSPALRRSRCAEGRQDHLWRRRHLRQPQPVHRAGRRHLGARPSDPVFGNLVFESLLMRSADEPFTLYGFIAETVETPPRPQLGRVHAQPEGEFSDGTAGHRRRRDLLPGASARQGPAELPRLLFQGRAAREGRRPRRPLPLRRTPTTASCR